MTQFDRLERELTAWFVDTAVPRTPDYTEDILQQTARIRQRPWRAFPGRWLPMSVVTLGRFAPRLVPWRTIGLLVMLALLLAVAIAAYVGSQRRLPQPFGIAGNGLVAYDSGGDIFTIDPATGERRPIVTGPESDSTPRFSLDGTRLVFMRGPEGGAKVPIIIDADGGHQVVADTAPLPWFDPESLSWSPDGRFIALRAQVRGTTYVVDAIDGGVKALDIETLEVEPFWRPPEGHELLAIGGTSSAPELYLVAGDDGTARKLAPLAGDAAEIWLSGWTPDGQQFVFSEGGTTHMLDVVSGAETVINVGYGQLSNDGTRVVGVGGDETRTWLCVANIYGGPCERISEIYAGSWDTGYDWSPDDEWIITTRSDDTVFLLDPDELTTTQPSWPSEGAESWQRKAP
jgi:Tol biopolymer transport system component